MRCARPYRPGVGSRGRATVTSANTLALSASPSDWVCALACTRAESARTCAARITSGRCCSPDDVRCTSSSADGASYSKLHIAAERCACSTVWTGHEARVTERAGDGICSVRRAMAWQGGGKVNTLLKSSALLQLRQQFGTKLHDAPLKAQPHTERVGAGMGMSGVASANRQ